MENLNLDNFNEKVEKQNGYVIIDFFATWCGPCKVMSKIIEEISKQKKDQIIYKVDVDKQVELAQKFEIMSIPTIIIFKDGKNIKEFIGVTKKEEILKIIDG